MIHNFAVGGAAIGVLLHAGRRIPEDVAAVGFDDSPGATSVRPALTTVRHPLTCLFWRAGMTI